MIKEAIVLAALAVSSPTVIDGNTVRIARRVDPAHRLRRAGTILTQVPARACTRRSKRRLKPANL